MPIPAILAVLFLVVPILEIFVIVAVGQQIGPIPTAILLIAESVFGAFIVRREGLRAWRALRAHKAALTLPGRELLDGALILIGGTLLLTPGFLTDILGFALVIPVTRAVARRFAMAMFKQRMYGAGGIWRLLGSASTTGSRGGRADPNTTNARPPGFQGPRVVEGEVVGDDFEDRQPADRPPA